MCTITYGSGSKPKVCNRAGAHTRDLHRYKVYVKGLAPVATTPPLALLFLVILSRATNRDKGYGTRPAFHTFVREGSWRGSSGTGFRLIAIYETHILYIPEIPFVVPLGAPYHKSNQNP